MKKTMLMAMVLLACLGALAQNKTGKNVPEVDITQAKRFAPLKVSEKATVEFIPLETDMNFPYLAKLKEARFAVKDCKAGVEIYEP